MTKAELRKVYQQWRAEEIEAIELIEAVAKYLGEWRLPSDHPTPR
ncbi:MAG: hypothetical protein AAAB13_20715 [Pseudomonas sp.]